MEIEDEDETRTIWFHFGFMFPRCIKEFIFLILGKEPQCQDTSLNKFYIQGEYGANFSKFIRNIT